MGWECGRPPTRAPRRSAGGSEPRRPGPTVSVHPPASLSRQHPTPHPPAPPPGPCHLCPSVHFWDLSDFLLFPQSLTFSFPSPQTHVCSGHGARCHISAKCPPAPSKGPAVMGLPVVPAEASPFPSAACRRVSAVGATISFLPLNRKRGGRS